MIDLEREDIEIVEKNGKLKVYFIPKPFEVACRAQALIDAVAFTFSNNCGADPIPIISQQLENLLGYGVIEYKGPFRCYEHTYLLGSKWANDWGLVCFGGEHQNNTIHVEIYGKGCTAAKPDWQTNLYDWLQTLPNIKLTRLDLAIDIRSKDYSVDQANQDWQAGKFDGYDDRARRQRVNFDNPHKGRTFYLNERQEGKYIRIYEKGKQLGDSKSDWIRVEIEWRSKIRRLPLEMLIKPNQYFAGAHAIFTDLISQATPIEAETEALRIIFKKSMKTMRRQIGAYIHAMNHQETPENILKKLEGKRLPTQLLLPCWQGSITKTIEILQGGQQDLFGYE